MNTIDLIFFTDLTTVNHKMCYLFHLCLTTDAGDKYSKIFSGYTHSKSLMLNRRCPKTEPWEILHATFKHLIAMKKFLSI